MNRLSFRSFFLIDAIGAALSAFSLGVVLVAFQSYIGIPVQTLRVLAFIAFALALYSTVCFLVLKKNQAPFLRLIALLNISYCVLTAFLIFNSADNITVLGKGYFLLEILIIGFLAVAELKKAQSSG